MVLADLSEIKSDVHLDLKLRTYNFLAKTSDQKRKSELLLASLLKIHYDKCNNFQECPCKKRKYLYDPKSKEYSDENL